MPPFFPFLPSPRGFAAFLIAMIAFPPAVAAQVAPAPAPPPAQMQARLLPGNPYGAIVPVEDESPKSREKGLRLALIQVLKGAVGREDPAVSPILALASRLVQQYGFVREATGQALMFRAVFDPVAVDQALRGQGLPVFGVASDLIETWVVQVHGLRSTADYSRVLRHFSRVPGVRNVDVDDLRGDTLQLRMVVEGGVQGVAERVETGGLIGRDATGRYVLAGR